MEIAMGVGDKQGYQKLHLAFYITLHCERPHVTQQLSKAPLAWLPEAVSLCDWN